MFTSYRPYTYQLCLFYINLFYIPFFIRVDIDLCNNGQYICSVIKWATNHCKMYEHERFSVMYYFLYIVLAG